MKTYLIKKGRHYSGWRFSPVLFPRKVAFKVKFDKSCLYVPHQFQGINKLAGLGIGFNHHKDSIRIGWTSDNEKIILWEYRYDNGVRSYFQTATVEVGEECLLEVVANKNHWFGFRLYPYFGGQDTAPRDIKIFLEWLK